MIMMIIIIIIMQFFIDGLHVYHARCFAIGHCKVKQDTCKISIKNTRILFMEYWS